MTEISKTCPREDRTPERRVFPGFTPDVANNVMARACKTAGIVQSASARSSAPLRLGDRPRCPGDRDAAQLGHARKSLTLDTYSHVLVDAGR